MSAKHTPGPWIVRPRPEIGEGLVASVTARWKICAPDGVSSGDAEADSKLIAAAPELAALLARAIKAWDEHDDVDSSWVAEGRAALAKAGL